MLTPYIKEFHVPGIKTIEEDTYYKIDPGDLKIRGFNNVQTSILPNGSLQYVREMERTMFWQPGSVNMPGAFRYKPYLVVEWENGIEKKDRDGIGDFISINPLDRVNNKEATAATYRYYTRTLKRVHDTPYTKNPNGIIFILTSIRKRSLISSPKCRRAVYG